MDKQSFLYSGKVKSLYSTDQDDLILMEFRDDITAFNGIKHEQLPGKGQVNNQINTFLMSALNQAGVPTHFQSEVGANLALVKKLQMLPLKSIMRNIAAGRFCRRLGVTVGRKLSPALYELYLKNDELRDPLVSDYHALSLGWATKQQLQEMTDLSFASNRVLTQLFSEHGMILVDYKLEFGVSDGKMYLADELSPDTCRIWDAVTHETLDKDRFRQDLGGVVQSYQQVAKRFKLEPGEIPKRP
ncbi:MAG: phosphoribosylaminoimidazolesuccinocarboxamide synthase [Proteobacteria bacterium]|nr:phosphoribosylaminoimidazolesuccinocarboxamide synthase [Pseudomonadota bacterium]